MLRYASRCCHCATALPVGTTAVWDSANKKARCLSCAIPRQVAGEVPSSEKIAVDFGTAGASAQRMYDRKEAKRRAHLRANWWVIALTALVGAAVGGWFGHRIHSSIALLAVIGAFFPLSKLLSRPQHIAAWRIGAAGEQQVGRMLDGLRREGVFAIHDRRVPRSTANIDHIVVSPAGIFVIDAKNVAGKVVATRSGLRVAGRRQDKMVEGVQRQVAVVREVLADQSLDPTVFRGVLCFTKAELPFFKPSPGGVKLCYPRGLRKGLREAGPLSAAQVQELAELIATRLRPA